MIRHNRDRTTEDFNQESRLERRRREGREYLNKNIDFAIQDLRQTIIMGLAYYELSPAQEHRINERIAKYESLRHENIPEDIFKRYIVPFENAEAERLLDIRERLDSLFEHTENMKAETHNDTDSSSVSGESETDIL